MVTLFKFLQKSVWFAGLMKNYNLCCIYSYCYFLVIHINLMSFSRSWYDKRRGSYLGILFVFVKLKWVAISYSSIRLVWSFSPNQNVCNYLNEQRRSGREMVIKLKLSAVVEMNWTELAVFQDRREMKFSPIVVARRRRRGADCLSSSFEKCLHRKNDPDPLILFVIAFI